MKKILILSIIIISTSMLTGCNGRSNKVETHKIDSNTTEYNSNSVDNTSNQESNIVDDTSNQESNIVDDTSNQESNITPKSNSNVTSNTTKKSNTVSNKKSNTTSNKKSNNNYTIGYSDSYDDFNGNHVLYREYIIGNGEVFGVMIDYDQNGKEKWRYTTKNVEDVQFPIYKLLGGDLERVLLKEYDDVIVFDISTGKQIGRIKGLANRLTLIENDYKYYYMANASNMYSFINSIYVVDRKTFKVVKKHNFSEKYSNCGYEFNNDFSIVLKKYDENKHDDVPKYRFYLKDLLESDWSEAKITEVK